MDFRDQEMWTTPLRTATETKILTTDWQEYSMSATAPTGASNPVFHTRVTFTADTGDQVDIDGVTMLTPVGVEGPGISAHTGSAFVASPNPFSSVTRIAFRLPRPGPVLLALYDVSGRQVARLIDGHHKAGEFVTRWDGRDHSGGKLSSGIYFLRLSAGGFTATRRLVLLQ
jgi:hypothetical protein